MKAKILIIRATSILKDSRTIKYINEFLDLGYDVEILGWDRCDEYDSSIEYAHNGRIAKIYYFKKIAPYGAGLKNVFNFAKFRKWIKNQIRLRDDSYIIYACDYDVASVAFKYRKNKKFIYDIYDYFADSRKLPKLLKNYFRKQENKIVNKSDAVVICTDQRKEQIKDAKPKKLFVIHNTPNVELKEFEFDLKSIEQNKIKVAYVGVLGESRLLSEILDEIDNYPQVELHIGGVGPYGEKVKDKEVNSKNVYYYGSMPYENVLRLERQCDILFATYDPKIPNHKYSAPNKFYEAGALSKPIIVCKDTGIDKDVEKYSMGIAINYNAKEFFDAVLKIGLNKETKEEYGKNGNLAYINYYSWERMKNKIQQLLDYVEVL